MTEKIWIVEVVRLKVIGTDTRTLVQVLGAIFVVLFPQLGTVAELDPLLAPGKDQKTRERREKGIKKKIWTGHRCFFIFHFWGFGLPWSAEEPDPWRCWLARSTFCRLFQTHGVRRVKGIDGDFHQLYKKKPQFINQTPQAAKRWSSLVQTNWHSWPSRTSTQAMMSLRRDR